MIRWRSRTKIDQKVAPHFQWFSRIHHFWWIFWGFPIKRLWSTWNLCPILGTQNFLLTRVFHKSNLVCHSGKIPMRAGNWLNWIHATKTIHFQGMMFDTTQSLGMDFFTHCKTRTRHRANFSASYDTAWSSRWKGAELQGQFQATSNIIFHLFGHPWIWMNFERLVGGAIFISWDMFSLKSKIGKKTRKRQERWKSKIRQNTTYQISVRNSSLTPRPRWFFVGRLTLWNFASSHWIRHGSIFLIKVGVLFDKVFSKKLHGVFQWSSIVKYMYI